MPLSERRSSSNGGDAGSLRSTRARRPPASSCGASSVSRKTSAFDVRRRLEAEGEDPQRHPGSSVGMVSLIGVPSPGCWPSAARRAGVETGGHEDRAALRVVVEHLGRIGGEQEPVIDGPPADLGAAALAGW